MDNAKALETLRRLADGIDIQSGQPLPEDSQFNHPDAIRALFAAIEALEAASKKDADKKQLPPMAGGKWDEAENTRLVEGFEAGTSVEDLAAAHQRTTGAIRSRLVKMGYFEQLEGGGQVAPTTAPKANPKTDDDIPF